MLKENLKSKKGFFYRCMAGNDNDENSAVNGLRREGTALDCLQNCELRGAGARAHRSWE